MIACREPVPFRMSFHRNNEIIWILANAYIKAILFRYYAYFLIFVSPIIVIRLLDFFVLVVFHNNKNMVDFHESDAFGPYFEKVHFLNIQNKQRHYISAAPAPNQ